MEKKDNALTVEQAIEFVTLMQKSAQTDYEEAEAMFDDPTYGEDYEDTLERKYNEGQADAFRTALDYFERALPEKEKHPMFGEKRCGFPCQDLSVAGKRAGLCAVCGAIACAIDHERIAREDKTNKCEECFAPLRDCICEEDLLKGAN